MNQKACDLETWYATSGTQVLGYSNVFKWRPWVDLDLCYGKVKFGPFCFCMRIKGKTMNFSETIVVYDIKLVDAVNKMSTWSFKNIKGHGHSLAFVQCHSESTFSNFFSLETTMPIEAKFHVELPWDGGMKVSTIGICHMTKMAIMYIYGKNLYKSSSLEPKGRCPWNFLYSIQAQPNLFKWRHWVDFHHVHDILDHVYDMIKFVP